ncbi:MAG: BlaI/MecI/CopY family transcriptional regulator [candidate division Zixibacteria bacterium]|nr:BlaI/MecI/CopY family transcriptional regulator [candidate division Zixibacteria bacterium]
MSANSFHFDISGNRLGVFLGPTEAKLMELVWGQTNLTVKSALFYLDRDDRRAYTTIMTVLNRLVDKGLLTRARDGRNYVYRAGIDRETFIRDHIKRIQACLKKNFPDAFDELTS